jgi:hypothetical protein
VQRDLAEVVDRSLHTQAVALQLLAVLTAVAGGLIVGQLLGRLTFLESAEHPTLAAVGMARDQRVMLGVARAGAIGAAAALVSLPTAIALSPVFPTGLARIAEPALGVRVDGFVLVVGAVAVAGGVVLLSAWSAWRVTRSLTRTGPEPLPARPSLAGRIVARGAPLAVSTGVRMALDPGRGRNAVPVRSGLAGVTLGIGTLVATITFGASLAHLLATPDLYGQTWDVEITTYDETLADRVALLEGDDRIDGVAAGSFRVLFEIDGRRVDGLILDTVKGDLAPAILEGRRPAGGHEIALGTRTMRRFDLAVGDRVLIAPFAEDRDPVAMKVVGRAVFPLFSEAGRLGDGAFASPAGWERIAGAPIADADTSLLLRLAPGVAVDEVTEGLEAELGTTIFVIGQGKPTHIVNFGRVETMPYVLGAILAAISIATLVHLLVSAIRRRRRELAILKTLGLVRGQVRGAVAWQATALVLVALVVGIPLGIATGRWAWTQFADELGVVPVSEVPLLALAVLVPLAVLVANLVAAVPAAMAASTRPVQLLRSE